ncbi:hypothetical protein FHT77_003846 [Rhizobium sp. BK181]|nr:hypothetical protein [Rhizobium sp. BK181]
MKDHPLQQLDDRRQAIFDFPGDGIVLRNIGTPVRMAVIGKRTPSNPLIALKATVPMRTPRSWNRPPSANASTMSPDMASGAVVPPSRPFAAACQGHPSQFVVSDPLRGIRIVLRTDIATCRSSVSIGDVEIPVAATFDVGGREPSLRREIGRPRGVERALTNSASIV